MNPDCARWTELSDRHAVGEALSLEAREFLQLHPASCAECAREVATFRGLLVPAASEDEPSDEAADDVLRRVALAAERERRARQLRWAAGAAAVLAAAASVALWPKPSGGPGAQVESSGAEARVSSTGDARAAAPPTAVPPAAPLASAAAGCSEVVAGVLACSAAGTVITRRDLDSAERFLELDRGRLVISLLPQPSGTSFSVVTAAGRVTAVGTIFSVESGSNGRTVARVLEGKVAVRAAGEATSRPLRAGESVLLGDPKASALTPEERELDLALLPGEVRARVPRDSAAAPSAPAPAPAVTPEALLKQALALRAQGQFRSAADVYRKIHQSSPTSTAGGTALVSLGELSLSSLNDPRGALAAFDAYLSRGGSLSQEAAFGKIRALRALGRTAEERAAIERFVAQYPGAPQNRILRDRLKTLGR